MNDIAIKNIDKIIEMYRDKKSLAEIGEMYGLKPQGTGTFIHALRKIGAISDEDIKARKEEGKEEKLKALEERNKNIVSDYKNFIDMEDIVNKYGIEEGTIRTVIRKSGIELNNRSYRHLEYPSNLIFDTFGSIDFEISEDVKRGLNFSFNALHDREIKILHEYYENESTLREIAKIFSLSADRVRQIKAKALRKLRHPSRSGYIKFGYDGYMEMIKKRERESQEDLSNKGISDIKIEELELSVRGYNCLKRAGVKTVSDIKSEEQLMRVRNLGRKTYDEILDKLRNIGYEVPFEEID